MERLRRLHNRKLADEAARKARTAFMANSGLTEEDLKAPDATDKIFATLAPDLESASDKEVDLVAWAKKERTYQFFVVRKAFADQHHFDVTDKKSAIDFMVNENLIAEDDVRIL
jgi:hypothetical protein